jgi:hypothetical protein
VTSTDPEKLDPEQLDPEELDPEEPPPAEPLASIPPDVPEADALEQSQPVPLDEDAQEQGW